MIIPSLSMRKPRHRGYELPKATQLLGRLAMGSSCLLPRSRRSWGDSALGGDACTADPPGSSLGSF